MEKAQQLQFRPCVETRHPNHIVLDKRPKVSYTVRLERWEL